LILLVLLASLPSLALLFLTASQQRDVALEAGREEAQRLVRLAVTNQRASAEQIELLLRTLAVRPELQDPTTCTQFLQTLPSGASQTSEPLANPGGEEFRIENAAFRSVSVANADGSIVCRGQVGGDRLDDADNLVLRRSLSAEQFSLGNVRADPEGGGLIVTYAYPLASDEQGSRAIVASLEVFALTSFAREARLPEDGFVMIFDSQGVLQQRYPPAPEQVGQSMEGTPIVDETIGRNPDREPPPEEYEIDGEPYIYETADLWYPGATDPSASGFVLVAFPKRVIVQRADEKFNENLGKLAIAGVVALIAAWIGADLFVARDSETRKALIRDLYHAFSTGSLEEVDDILGPNYIDRTPNPGQAEGPDGLKQNIAAFRAAFPDGEILPRELLADRDKVVARVTLTGTHLADYFGMRPSGTPVTADGVETFRFADGMVVESWSLFGELRPLRQARVVAPEEPVASNGRLSRLFRRRKRLETKHANAD
jgi:predicted ester cyclase